MAGFSFGSCMQLVGRNCRWLKPFLYQQNILQNHVRSNHMFRHLAQDREHESKYLYEISRDPKEWEFVEKLMPLVTVPVPTIKPNYPSGWRPPKDGSHNSPYFVERSKNHMLSAYLINRNRGQVKMTEISRIHGDIWRLHSELKEHLERELGKKIASFVHEGNSKIRFKGDLVYYAEQWLLQKGF